jgi:hypothetical protein
MRQLLACLLAVGLIGACSRPPAENAASSANAADATPATAPAAAGPAVSGVYTAGGQAATLTEVTAHNDEPFGGKPVMALVFTAQTQAGDANAMDDAHLGKFGDAIIVRVEPDGTIIGSDLIHRGLAKSSGYISGVGLVTLKDYRAAGGEISGRLTSGGPSDAFDQPINIDLTFHTKAP